MRGLGDGGGVGASRDAVSEVVGAEMDAGASERAGEVHTRNLCCERRDFACRDIVERESCSIRLERI